MFAAAMTMLPVLDTPMPLMSSAVHFVMGYEKKGVEEDPRHK
jgi:hypothetical protein